MPVQQAKTCALTGRERAEAARLKEAAAIQNEAHQALLVKRDTAVAATLVRLFGDALRMLQLSDCCKKLDTSSSVATGTGVGTPCAQGEVSDDKLTKLEGIRLTYPGFLALLSGIVVVKVQLFQASCALVLRLPRPERICALTHRILQKGKVIDNAIKQERGELAYKHFSSQVELAVDKVNRWKTRCLRPWKYSTGVRTDEELEQAVDTVFMMYASSIRGPPTLEPPDVLRLCRDAGVYDNVFMPRVRHLWLPSLPVLRSVHVACRPLLCPIGQAARPTTLRGTKHRD